MLLKKKTPTIYLSLLLLTIRYFSEEGIKHISDSVFRGMCLKLGTSQDSFS